MVPVTNSVLRFKRTTYSGEAKSVRRVDDLRTNIYEEEVSK